MRDLARDLQEHDWADIISELGDLPTITVETEKMVKVHCPEPECDGTDTVIVEGEDTDLDLTNRQDLLPIIERIEEILARARSRRILTNA